MTRLSTTLLGASALTALLATTGFASAQTVPDVPRNRTLISQGWDFYNQVPSIDNFNPYAGVLLHQRNSLHYTVNEVLFYTNHNTNETVGWQADSYTYNADFTEVTLKLRDGVKWSDGEAFTADDVAFTFDMLKAAAPDPSAPDDPVILRWRAHMADVLEMDSDKALRVPIEHVFHLTA